MPHHRSSLDEQSVTDRRPRAVLAVLGVVLTVTVVAGVGVSTTTGLSTATETSGSRSVVEPSPTGSEQTTPAGPASPGRHRPGAAPTGSGAAGTGGYDADGTGTGDDGEPAGAESTEGADAGSPAADEDGAVATAVPGPGSSAGRTSSTQPPSRSSSATTVPPSAAGRAPAAGSATAGLLPAGSWLSGSAGDGVTDGSFAAWRGSAVPITGTWVDNNDAMTALWQLQPDGEFGDWDAAIDVAIGAIGDGESWAEAADGAYDDRWRESLTNLAALRGDKSGATFIRFAHEMNGNWYDWSVDAGDKDDFVAAWRRFRALQQEVFPSALLVFCVNRESVDSGFDWRESFPGAQYVDVMGVDYYNQYPYVASSEDWDDSVDAVDSDGAPKGLQAHLDFARSVGLPLAVPEWSGHADNGDSPAFIREMHDFFSRNAGDGPGQVLYDVQFNIGADDGRWVLYGDTQMPASAQAYREVF